MPTLHNTDRDRLREIKTFPSLVKYLREELDWPIESDDFEEISFDYTPEELGIDEKTAVKIDEIKQLRPLSSGQPWGIFFVKFAPKRLPVVALRRILGRLVVKKRASANKADRAAWDKHDLLFISNYGEGEERQITFAHFTDNDHHGDLPTLKVLGWDQEDTALHLDHVQKELQEHLRWPEDTANLNAWRQRWSGAFELKHREVITTSKQLALRLADLARSIRKRCNAAMKIETEHGPLRSLMRAFQQALIHDLTQDDFADMYAQTISYGLLSARVSRPAGLTANDLTDMVPPQTNPFLKELLETFLNVGGRKWSDHKGKLTGIDFDELGINDVVDTLRGANMEAVLLDFGNRNPTEDPVIHFYELFLKEYDAKKRMQRGVFYTPRPVVSYIVRSVHELLQTEFGLADGLADTSTWAAMLVKHEGLKLPEVEDVDPETRKVSKKPIHPSTPFVQILDPACGTGTFLVEVIDVIYNHLRGKWSKEGHGDLWIDQKWNEYVPRHLLPRLYGYELMMAPYAIAHMKIGLKLFETGYKFGSGERARIYLTNALEPPQDFSDTFEQMAPALAHEAKAVNHVKRHQRFTVVLGNPPYSKLSANLSPEARSMIEPYRFVDGVKIKERGALQFEMNLQEDYVKFIRFCESQISAIGYGVHGLITNSGYLSTPTLRGMRSSLSQTFRRLRLLDLHGHVATSSALGSDDENIFDIQQGVAVMLMSAPVRPADANTAYADLRGSREDKYQWLQQHGISSANYLSVTSLPPLYRFVPEDNNLRAEFEEMEALTTIFPRNSAGFISSRDGLVIGENSGKLIRSIQAFGIDRRPDDKVYTDFNFAPSKRLNLRDAQAAVRAEASLSRYVRPVLYRPFDLRYVFYKRELIESFKPIAFELAVPDNLVLLATRQVTRPPHEHVFVSREMIEIKACSHDRNTQIFPLFIREHRSESDGPQMRLNATDVRLNLSPTFVKRIAEATGLQIADEITGRDIFHYLYAVLHSPAYRVRYFDMLKSEFPRCPSSPPRRLFKELANLGKELIGFHLLESPRLATPLSNYVGRPEPEIQRLSYAAGTVWLDKKQTCGFVGVPEAVWNFHIGGYQVCQKWLKDRKGRTLSKDDIEHYQKIVVAISETIRLMKEIDETIERHGGWPGAFVTDPEKLKEFQSAKKA